MRRSKHHRNRISEPEVNVARAAGSDGRAPTETQSSRSPERPASAAPRKGTRPPAGGPATQRQLGSSRTTTARPAGKGDEASASAWETDGGSGT